MKTNLLENTINGTHRHQVQNAVQRSHSIFGEAQLIQVVSSLHNEVFEDVGGTGGGVIRATILRCTGEVKAP